MLRAPSRRTCAALLVAACACTAARQDAAGERVVAPDRASLGLRWFDWTDLSFPRAEHEARRWRMLEGLRAAGGGVFLCPSLPGVSDGSTFRQDSNFLYFTGLELPRSMLALDAEADSAVLFAPRRDARMESTTRPNDFPGRALADDPELAERSGLEVRPLEELDGAVAGWVAAGRTLWIDPRSEGPLEPVAPGWFDEWDPARSLQYFLQLRHPEAVVRSAYALVARLRMVKSPAEIAVLRRACDVTVQALAEAATFLAPGVDERTLEAELEAAFKRRGAQRLAFASIIKSGPNSLWPWRVLAAHYDRRNREMQSGELVIFDVGCELDHHASDLGRTFPVSGSFTPEQARLVEMATRASDAVLAAIRPGVTFAELCEVALAAVPEEERRFMQTSLFFGHHVGLDVGDPSLAAAPLEPGMVFTVEPWYYHHERQIAVFLEDVVLVTEDGVENLTTALPRTTRDLERWVQRSPRRE